MVAKTDLIFRDPKVGSWIPRISIMIYQNKKPVCWSFPPNDNTHGTVSVTVENPMVHGGENGPYQRHHSDHAVISELPASYPTIHQRRGYRKDEKSDRRRGRERETERKKDRERYLTTFYFRRLAMTRFDPA